MAKKKAAKKAPKKTVKKSAKKKAPKKAKRKGIVARVRKGVSDAVEYAGEMVTKPFAGTKGKKKARK
jgi:hypothetical protein